MKLLIVGATGYIGRFITTSLSEFYGKDNIDIYVRSLEKARVLDGLVNSIFVADLLKGDLKFLKSKHYDCIILAHGKILGHTYKSIYLNNRKTVRNILRNINKIGLRQIIYLSSVAAGGFKDDIDGQASMLNPNNAYGLAKLKTEELLIRFGFDNAIRVAIFRPPVVYGSVSGIDFDYFIKECKTGNIRYFSGNPYVSLCSVENLVNATICAIKSNANGVYQIADDRRYTIQDVCDIIRIAYGLKKIRLFGYFLGPIVNKFTNFVLRFNNFSFPYIFLLQAMHNPYYCNIEKAKNKLGYKPKDSFDKYFTKELAAKYFSKTHLD
jgi:nucleoside-diphosphate-sugar epimerase